MSLKTSGQPSSKGVTYGRRPYVQDTKDETYQDMMRKVPRSAIQAQVEQPESQMDKPYLNDDYQAMEHYNPPPYTMFGYPDLVWPKFPGPVPVGLSDIRLPKISVDLRPIPSAGGGLGSEYLYSGGGVPCMLSVYGPFYCSQNGAEWTDKINIRLIVANTTYMPSFSAFINNIKVTVNGKEYPRSNSYDTAESITTNVVGSIAHMWIVPPSTGWTIGDEVRVFIPDKYNLNQGVVLCRQNLTVHCFEACCPADTTFEWDTDNNPTTIASGGSADIYVQGGCPPYTYTVSGTGATWNNGGGAVVVSNNTNEQLDVAGGQ